MTYQEIYNQALSNGCSPVMADMLASRQGPGLKTDTSMYAGFGTLEKQFEDNQPHLRKITEEAQKRGYKPNPNYVYEPSLATFVGDPLAFVPPNEAENHIRHVCEKRGMGCQGAVNIKPPQVEPKQGPRLAEDLVREGVGIICRENPDKAFKPQRELREEAIERFAPEE